MFVLTIEDINSGSSVEDCLRACGVSGRISDMGRYYSFSSPFHDDKHPSMVLYKDTLACIDWSGDFRGSLNKLMKEKTGVSLYKYLGITPKERDDTYYKNLGKQVQERSFANAYADSRDGYALSDYKTVIHGDQICYDLSKNQQALDYARSRFIDDEFADFFHVGWVRDSYIYRIPRAMEKGQKGTHFVDRLMIPIYRGGTVCSIEGRDYTRKQEKKCIYPIGGDVSSLFNIDNLRKDQPLILVEGVMDMVRIWQHITKNVAPVFGIQITSKQADVIKTFPDIIVMSDSDEAGEKMIHIVDSFYDDREFRVARLATGDPGDACNSVDDIKRAIDNAVPCNEYFMGLAGFGKDKSDDSGFFSV